MYGLISKFNNLGLQLLSLTPVGPTLQEVFEQVTAEAQMKGEVSEEPLTVLREVAG
jgi:hypothetical protein